MIEATNPTMHPAATRSILVIAALIASAALITPPPVPAAPAKGGGGGNQNAAYTIAVTSDPLWTPAPTQPTYSPACLAETPGPGGYTALFPRHDLCATVTTSSGSQLTDEVLIQVNAHKGFLTSVQLRGQDVIGEEGIAHESEQIPLLPPLEPDPAGFTVHVHADNVPIWKLSRHLGGKRVEIIGYISIADMVYTPN